MKDSSKNILFTFIALILFFGIVELFAYIAHITGYNSFPEKPIYNRTLSGYYVCKNTPNFTFFTSKVESADPDIKSDQWGFICEHPISIEKPENTIRIFLMGGSALLGAGQFIGEGIQYGQIHQYPGGLHPYRTSIAGRLKQFLEKNYPSYKYEVINASMYTKTFHQSFLQYLESVSMFSPDYVINMDGFNEPYSSTPYQDLEAGIDKYITLLNHSREQSPIRIYSYNLLKNIIKRLTMAVDKYKYSKGTWNKTEKNAPGQNTPAKNTTAKEKYTKEYYFEHKAEYVRNSKRFEQILKQYMAVLHADGVKFIFTLQPILRRAEGNKELSEIEQAFNNAIGNDCDQKDPVFRYFLDDYFSDRLKEVVENAGYQYIDLGRQIKPLKASFEFYTDYCHLTPQANEFIAHQMGEIILADINTTKK